MGMPLQSSKLVEVFLCRHGETEWTLTGQHTGLTDLPLTENGRKEAKLLGKSFKKKGLTFNHVMCSPLHRVRETCKLAGIKEDDIIIDKRLLEWDYGAYEGLTSEEIHKTNPGWTVFNQDPPDGETAIDVEERVDSLLEDVLKLEGTVALFSSGHISRVIGARWVKMPVSFGQNLKLSTGSDCRLGFDHNYPAIITWNDISHLHCL